MTGEVFVQQNNLFIYHSIALLSHRFCNKKLDLCNSWFLILQGLFDDAVSHRKSPENAGGKTAENTALLKLHKSRLQIITACFLWKIRILAAYETAVPGMLQEIEFYRVEALVSALRISR